MEATSIFKSDPFKEFAQKKFKELMDKESMEKIIQMREKALEIRHKTQMETINQMFTTNKYSPKTFQNKKVDLEKWVERERANIQTSKKDIEKGWFSTQEFIKRVIKITSFNIQFNRHKGT